jgi:hypothetical protein
MELYELSGTYTYRSFLNEPGIVNDFKKLQFAEAELTLFAGLDGSISGTLSWPKKEDDDSERDVMDIEGKVVTREPLLVRLHGVGRKGSAIEAYDYQYELTLAKHWPETTRPRTCLVGSVIRVKDHGKAKAGVTASVIAVQRDFVEPRDIPGVALAPSTVAMLASKWHRLWHATWHTVRGEWPNFKDENTRAEIKKLGWGVDRAPRKPRAQGSNLVLDNGAGEDFLFMHRWMIQMVRSDYARQNLTPPASWKTVPAARVAQIVYTATADEAGVIKFKKDLAASGNMVPQTGDWVKTQEYLSTVMQQWEAYFTSPTTLATLSLGALGNLLEFTIHNAMHNRWSTPARDPETGEIILDPATGEPGEREQFDFSDKWNSPRYDYLGEFYSSHINPLFWRLHGWVDDRIEDWFRAQEASNPGRIKRRTLLGVDWFEVSAPWVMVPSPFAGVSLEGHGGPDHGHGGQDAHAAEIETMLKVLAAIKNDGQAPVRTPAALAAAAPPSRPSRISMRFEMPDTGQSK